MVTVCVCVGVGMLLAGKETDFALYSVSHCRFKKKKRPGVTF